MSSVSSISTSTPSPQSAVATVLPPPVPYDATSTPVRLGQDVPGAAVIPHSSGVEINVDILLVEIDALVESLNEVATVLPPPVPYDATSTPVRLGQDVPGAAAIRQSPHASARPTRIPIFAGSSRPMDSSASSSSSRHSTSARPIRIPIFTGSPRPVDSSASSSSSRYSTSARPTRIPIFAGSPRPVDSSASSSSSRYSTSARPTRIPIFAGSSRPIDSSASSSSSRHSTSARPTRIPIFAGSSRPIDSSASSSSSRHSTTTSVVTARTGIRTPAPELLGPRSLSSWIRSSADSRWMRRARPGEAGFSGSSVSGQPAVRASSTVPVSLSSRVTSSRSSSSSSMNRGVVARATRTGAGGSSSSSSMSHGIVARAARPGAGLTGTHSLEIHIYSYLSPCELGRSRTVNVATSRAELQIPALHRQQECLTSISWKKICTYRNALGLLRGRTSHALLTEHDCNEALKYCKNVTHLDFRRRIRPSFRMSIELLPAVRSIDLSLGCCNLRDTDLTQLVTQCTRLDSLDLSACALTDAGIAALARHCRDLTVLKLCCCLALTDAGIAALAEGCRDLTYLDLSATRINGACLDALAENCQRLVSLNLSATTLTEAGLAVSPAKNFSALTSLTFVDYSPPTNTSLLMLVQRCPNLIFLAAGTIETVYNPERWDAIFDDVGAACPKIASLDLYCHRNTTAILDTVAEAFPMLTSLTLDANVFYSPSLGVTIRTLHAIDVFHDRHPRIQISMDAQRGSIFSIGRLDS